MKSYITKIFSFIAILLLITTVKFSFGQSGCPSVNAGPDVTVGCGNNCTTLNATVVPTGLTTSYGVSSIPYAPPFPFNGGAPIIVNVDDRWSDVIPLPFSFCFYGNTYTQIVAGSNGVLTFDAAQANGYCPWSYTASCPSASLPMNAIFGVFQDTDPTYQGMIDWQLSGTFPCRMFVISFYELPYFGGLNSVSTGYCTSPPIYATSQIVLYESTSVIEVYIQDKYVCTGWNSGNGLVGLQDANGINGIAAPGRNTGAWTAHNEAWRFYPNGTAGYTITWFNGSTVLGIDSTGVNPFSIQVCPNATTTYTAEVDYTLCTGLQLQWADPVTVNYNAAFSINASPASDSLCPGQSATLNASTTHPNVNFTWSPATGLNTTIGPTVIATPSTTTIYTVTGVDNTNCSMSVPITVTVYPNPVVTITPSNATICTGTSATLTAHGANTYLWSPPTGLSSTSDSVVTANPASAMSYTVVGTSHGCTGQAGVNVSISPDLVLSVIPPNPNICIGDSVTLTAGGADSYVWSPPAYLSDTTGAGVVAFPVAATTYTVNGTSLAGCTGSTTVTVGTAAGALISFSPSAPAICQGASVDIEANGATSYSWNPPSGLSSSTGNQVTASPLSTITYTTTGNTNGCLSTAEITVSVEPIPVPDFNSDVTQGCQPLLVKFQDHTQANIFSWSWNFGDGTHTNPITAVPDPEHLYPDAGQYDVTLLITTVTGCQAQLMIPQMITVFRLPIASFVPDPSQVWINEPTINFFDESINAGQWYWDFGDFYYLGDHSSEQNPSHTYSDTGTYYVTLVVTSPNGCMDSMVQSVHIEPLIAFYAPNAFTPNNDGKNDAFTVKGDGIDEGTFTMRIFNRWGQEIYFTRDINKGWDGRPAGSDIISTEGTYCYIITFNDIKENYHHYKGFIQLIR